MQEHVESVGTYTVIFVLLLLLTVATTVVATIDLGAFNVVMALAIAVVKMLLVALFFMHLRHSSILSKLVVGSGLLWLAILLILSLGDFVTRMWLPVPGK
jgi:cytochrome c oxidase subunit 4